MGKIERPEGRTIYKQFYRFESICRGGWESMAGNYKLLVKQR